MRNKLFLFLMLALFGSTSFLRADEVTIGDPTSTVTNSYLPTYSLYNYAFTQQIYTADEIGMGGSITEFTMWLKNSSSYARNLNVYMKEVSETAFADGSAWVSMTESDMVATGTLANGISDPTEMTFTLTTPFAYSGEGSLVICFQDVTGSWSSGAASVVMTCESMQAIYAYRDSGLYDPTTPGVTGYVTANKSVVRLNITPGGSGGGTVSGELTVHDGGQTNGFVPIYGFYADAYLKCEMVYPAAELAQMDGASINSIKFYPSTPASEAWTSTWQVFVAEVADATISDFYGPGTVVYEGTLDGTLEEMEIVFDAPYTYNGGNLLIGVYNIATGNYKSVTWAGETVAGASVQGYNYSSLSGITASQRDFLPKTTFYYESGSGPVPPVPTDPVAITPNPFDMGYRPINGWMEPMVMRIHNGMETSVTMTGNMSNTAGVNAFVMSEEIDEVVLESGEDFTAEIDINRNAAAGDYAEQFTLFYIENDRDITLVPVTATFYEAGEADIVETAPKITSVDNFSVTPENIYPNYIGADGVMANDAVYWFELTEDALFSVEAGEGSFIGIYNKVLDFHPTYTVEPVAYAMGQMQDQILLAGQYYMIVAGDAIGTISGSATELPAPTEITNLTPENGAAGVEGNSIELTWEGGEYAAEYQVLFGTSPTNTAVALDWTVVDENYGTFEATGLVANTQYFWQIKVRNSNGTVNGPRWGFTTSLTTPHDVTATPEEIFVDGSTLIKWKYSDGAMGDLDEMQIGSGTGTSSYLPTYNLYNYSLTEQIYTSEELGGTAGYINSISFHPVGDITRNLKVYMANTDKESFTGGSDWVAMTAENLVYEGNVSMVANTWVTIQFAEPFEYEGENLILAVTDHTGTWTSSIQYSTFDATGQAINIYQDSAPYSALAPSGSGTVRDFKNQIIINKDDSKGELATRTFLYYNLYYGDVKVNDEPIYEKQYLLSDLPYNVEPGHDVSVTAVYNEGESAKSAPVVVKVSGYGSFTGQVTELIEGTPLEGVNVKFVGKDEFNNNVAYEGTTNAYGYYTINDVKAGNYIGTATLEGMEPKSSDPVTLAYDATETVDFVMHEVYVPVLSVVAEEMDPELARVRWSLNVNIPVPTPGGNTPGGGSASTFTEGFENGLPADWTVVDGNNDGYTWCLTSAIPSTWTYYAGMTLDWYRTGTNAICSGSYINGVGALTPNEYLVMGQQNLVNGSTLSFWAAATDASYPADHFGVFVSDDASDWTSVQEWTLTAKGGAHNGGRESRDGNGAKLGTWYQYSVDLSAYAGQKYIAIRHFNCNDQYIMCVDDIELSTAKGTRDVFNYNVYRAAILTEDGEPLNVADIEDLTPYYIGSVVGTDTLYADFDWANMEPGLYQYGVAANYPDPNRGNRDEVIIGEGASTNSYVPTYNLYNYSCTNQIYTNEEIGGAGTISSIAFMPTTVNAASRNLDIYMVNSEKTSFAGATDWTPVTDADLVYSGTVNWTANAWSTITLTNPFQFDGSNLIVIVNDKTGSWTSSNSYKADAATAQAIRIYQDAAAYNPSAPGNGTVIDYKNQIKLDITYGGGAGGNDNPYTAVTWSNVLPKDIETTVVLNAQVPDASAEGVTVRFNNVFENTTFTITLDETGTDTITDFRKGEYMVTFDLLDYNSSIVNMPISIWNDTVITAVFEEIFKPIETISATRSGYVTWNAVIPVDRVAENYVVLLDGTPYAETVYNFIQIDEDDLTVGQTYTVGVRVMYTTGISEAVYTTFTYADCTSATHQVEDLTATNEPGNTNVTLAWNGATPTPPTPPTPPTGGWTEGFESGLNGWTVLTLNADGGEWLHSNNNPGGYDYSSHAHGGSGFAMCYSFVDYVGAYNTDSYLITPQMNSVSAGSTLTFWADNANDSYPENFSVCVSTAANPSSASDFTTVWSGGAKGTGDGAMVRHNNNRYDNWRSHTIDLSAYAGQNVWIAFHDVNYDMYEVWIDDVEFTTAAKLGGNITAAGVGFGAANNALTDDGNWYYYDNGSNEDAIGTGGGNFWWGIMLPAGSYEGNRLTKVAAYDYMAMSGTASIYQGGSSAPAGSALGTVNVSMSGSSNFVEYEFAEPIEIDPTQNVWVVFYNASGATYPAAVCANTGDANGRWVSLDGSTWADLVSYSLNYTFMVRAYIESGSGPAPAALVPNKYNIFVDGELVGATASNTFTYDATDFAEHEYVVIWVDSDYLESCVDDENDIFYAAAPLGVAENMISSMIYPNPTDGEIRINANNMERISIVNALGQVVYDKAVEGNEAIINMAQFGNGVYMVNIATESGTSVKRVIVSK